jgi:hypothetical protein
MRIIYFLLVLAALAGFVIAAFGHRIGRVHPGWAGLALWVTIEVIQRWPG